LALPWSSDAYGTRKREKNPHKAYTSTHAIRISADDMQWFSEQARPGEKTHTTFHRLRMELARLSNENDKVKETWIPPSRIPEIREPTLD
jgi:hypothetical protein